MKNCIFCEINRHNIPSFIIDENEYAIAILPKDMECFGHTLIIPKKHFENIFDIDDEYLQNFILFMKSLSIKYKHGLGATGINLLNANGKDAQQSIPHLHFHLIPRFPNDAMDVWPKFEKYNGDHKTDLNKIKNLII